MATDAAATATKVIDTYGSVVKSLQSGNITTLFGGTKSIEQARQDGDIIDYQNGAVRLNADGGTAEVYVDSTSVVLASDQNTALAVYGGCTVVDSRLHVARAPHDITVNGFWVFNEELLTTVPSTLMHPVQTLLFKYPAYAKKAAKLMKLLMLG